MHHTINCKLNHGMFFMTIKLKYYKIKLFVLSLLLVACSSRDITYNATAVSFEADGYLDIEIWNINEGASYEPEQALKDALNNILYFGVLSNNKFTAQKPLLLTIENRENFKRIENEFFKNNGTWSKFARMSSNQSASTQNLSPNDFEVYRVSIAKGLLRKYLEEQKIINPITTGF